ncbi:MAG: hypothetical protein JRN37_01485 [Nitrososphaerota archaeon]|nr:hypothetical protein [Nitrososphaerota archaeon]
MSPTNLMRDTDMKLTSFSVRGCHMVKLFRKKQIIQYVERFKGIDCAFK